MMDSVWNDLDFDGNVVQFLRDGSARDLWIA